MRHRFLLAVIGPMLVAASMGADCVYECLQNHGCMDGPDINCPYCHEMLGDCNPDGVTQLSRAYNPAGAVLYLAVSGGNQQYTAVDAICYKQQACGEGSALWLYACTVPGRESCIYPIIPAPIYCTYCSKVGAVTNILTSNATCKDCES
jgi:hypothetical protein